MVSKSLLAHLGVFFLGLTLLAITNKSTGRSMDISNREFLMPPKDLRHFTLGYNETFADSLWIRVIQDFEVCERDKSSLLDDTVSGPGRLPGEGESRCHQGWVFHMLDVITELAPRFHTAYEAGGMMLSVIVDDRVGAKEIFDKGLRQFPNDWRLSYRAAYHYLFELKDEATAAKLLNHAALNGGPGWLPALAARLYSKLGQAQYARTVLIDALRRTPEGEWTKRLQDRLNEVEQTIQSESRKENHN